MSNNRELSQIANLIEVIDQTRHINVKQATGQNVGVGITNPSTKVHVIGDATISSDLNVGGNLSASNISIAGLAITNNASVGGAMTVGSLEVSGQSNLVGLTSTIQLNVTGLTTTQNLAVAGFSTFYDDIRLDKYKYFYIGDGNNSHIYASGSVNNNSVTLSQSSLSNNGSLTLKGDTVYVSSGSDNGVTIREDSSEKVEVILGYDGNERLRTVGTGITVNGSIGVKTDVYVWGNIGVNTDAPSQPLHVDGNVYVSGTVQAGAINANITEANYAPVAGIATFAQGISQYPDIEVTSIGATSSNISQTLNVGPGGAFLKAAVAGVGFGTLSPYAPIDVYGNAKITDGHLNLILGTEETGYNLHAVPNNVSYKNILIGHRSGYNLYNGDENVCLGYESGYSLDGSNNVFIGFRAGILNDGYVNDNVCIGHDRSNVISTGSTQLTIGSRTNDWIIGDSNFNVGIGLTNPSEKFEVSGNAIIQNQLNSGTLFVNDSGSTSGVSIQTLSTGEVGIGMTPIYGNKLEITGNSFVSNAIGIGATAMSARLHIAGGVTQPGGEANIIVQSSSPSSIPSTISSNSSTGTLSLFSGGLGNASQRGGQIDFIGGNAASYAGQIIFRSGISTGGTIQPINARLDTTGVLYATTFTSTSDERKKENIETLSNPHQILDGIRGVRFDWRDNGKPSVGVIAQEVEKVLPEAVHSDEDGMKSVSYDMLIGVLIETVKDQQKRIEDLENKLNAK